jgi:hypothetical protein
MKFGQLAIVIVITAIVAYYVHDYLDNNRDAHPELR